MIPVLSIFTDVWYSIAFAFRFFFRLVISSLDGLFYSLDALLYDLAIDIANTRVISVSMINTVAGRVYQLLTLIMMFRLIFVSITYIVNPEAMMDKTKGYGNIVKKIIITLILIIVVPWGFRESRNIQAVILDDGVIEYFVFGQNSASSASGGNTFMSAVSKIFYVPYQCRDSECKNFCDANNLKESACGAQNGHLSNVACEGDWTNNLPSITFEGNITNAGTDKCGYALGSDTGFAKNIRDFTTPSGGKYDFFALVGSARRFDKETVYNNGYDSDFYMKMTMPVISTLIGLAIGYMLIIICIDIAVRSVKLAFYEMISPIPIISYIGMKDGKDSMLSKWFTQVLKTYGSLFIRIAGLQLAVLFITEMIKNFKWASSNVIVLLFLLIGILTFAKEIPQIIKDLGINFEGGGFSLKKKLQPIAPLAGTVAGIAGGVAGNISASRAIGRKGFKTAMSGLGGAFSGAVRGIKAGFKDKEGMGVQTGFGAAGRGGQKIVKNKDTTLRGRMAAGVQQRLGLDTAYDKSKKRYDALGELESLDKQADERAEKKVFESNAALREERAKVETMRQGIDEEREDFVGVDYTDRYGVRQTAANVNIATTKREIAELERRSAEGFRADENATMSGVTYKDSTGATRTRALSMSQVRAYLDRAIAAGAPAGHIASLRTALTDMEKRQRADFETTVLGQLNEKRSLLEGVKAVAETQHAKHVSDAENTYEANKKTAIANWRAANHSTDTVLQGIYGRMEVEHGKAGGESGVGHSWDTTAAGMKAMMDEVHAKSAEQYSAKGPGAEYRRQQKEKDASAPKK